MTPDQGWITLTDAGDGAPITIRHWWITGVFNDRAGALVEAPGYGGRWRVRETRDQVQAVVDQARRHEEAVP